MPNLAKPPKKIHFRGRKFWHGKCVVISSFSIFSQRLKIEGQLPEVIGRMMLPMQVSLASQVDEKAQDDVEAVAC